MALLTPEEKKHEVIDPEGLLKLIEFIDDILKEAKKKTKDVVKKINKLGMEFIASVTPEGVLLKWNIDSISEISTVHVFRRDDRFFEDKFSFEDNGTTVVDKVGSGEMMDYVEPGVYYYTVLYKSSHPVAKLQNGLFSNASPEFKSLLSLVAPPKGFYDRFIVKVGESEKSGLEGLRKEKEEALERHKIKLEIDEGIQELDRAAAEKKIKKTEEWYKTSIQAIDLDPDTTEEEKRKKKETLELDYYAKMDRLKK